MAGRITKPILVGVDSKVLLGMVAWGVALHNIAIKFGASVDSVEARLKKESPEAYREARQLGIETRLASSRNAMKKARTAFQFERAREAFKADRWLAMCEFPERWGETGPAHPSAKGKPGAPQPRMIKLIVRRPAKTNKATPAKTS